MKQTSSVLGIALLLAGSSLLTHTSFAQTVFPSATSYQVLNNKSSAKAYYKQGLALFKVANYPQATAMWQQATQTGTLSSSQYTNMITRMSNIGDYLSAHEFAKSFVFAYPATTLSHALKVKTAQLLDADTTKGLAIESIQTYNNFLLNQKRGAEINKSTLLNNYNYQLIYYTKYAKDYDKAREMSAKIVALTATKTQDAVAKLGSNVRPLAGSYLPSNTAIASPVANIVVSKLDTPIAPAKTSFSVISAEGILAKGDACFVEGNYDCARQNWEAADKLGSAVANKKLGILYEKGLGVPQDYTKALELYQVAAIKGVPEANGLVGNLFENGLGVDKDLKKAQDWYNKGKEMGDSSMNKKLAALLLIKSVPTSTPATTIRSRVASTPATTSAASTASSTIAETKANTNPNTVVYTNTVIAGVKANASADELYNKGFDFYKANNFDEARATWEKAATTKTNSAAKYKSMHELGKLYSEGQGVPQDYEKAMDWYVKASANGLPIGSAEAAKSVGTLYENGFGTPADDVKALEWYKRAQRMGNKYVADDVKRIASRLKR